MTWELAQHAVVTVVATGAALVLARQVLAFVRPKAGQSACANCPSGQRKSRRAAPAAAPTAVVLQIQRPPAREQAEAAAIPRR